MSGNDGDPRFEIHIRPMMRLLDRERMIAARGMDLWSYEKVKEFAQQISTRVRVDMPPVHAGGLWPQEWVALFDRWANSGCRRLEVGRPNVPWDVSRNGDSVTILGQTELPDETYQAWLEPEFTDDAARVYTLYWRDPDHAPEPPLTPREVVFEEVFSVGPNEKEVLIVDESGEHRFDIQR